MVDGSVGSGGSRGELSELDDFSTALLDTRSKLLIDPDWINEAESIFSLHGGVSDIGVHRWRVVAPDGKILNVGNLGAGLEGELGDCSVVVETGHSRKGAHWEVLSVVLTDQGVCVSGVADNDSFDITSTMVVDGLANIDENLAVVFEEVSTLHAWATGLGTNQEVVVDLFESGFKVTGADYFVKQREGTVVELSLYTLEDLLLEWQVE